MASKNKKKGVTRMTEDRRQFSFQGENNANLSFNLRVDNTSELRPFREVLMDALVVVEEEIAKHKN